MILIDTITSASPITLSIGALIFIITQTGSLVIAWYNMRNRLDKQKLITEQQKLYYDREIEEIKTNYNNTSHSLSNFKTTTTTQFSKIYETVNQTAKDVAYIKGKIENEK